MKNKVLLLNLAAPATVAALVLALVVNQGLKDHRVATQLETQSSLTTSQQ